VRRELPDGWESARLGEAAEINMGQSPPGESYNDQQKGLPLLNGPAEFGKDHPIARQWTSKITKKSKVGDILFCVRGATAGRMNRADQVYCLGRGLAAIRGKQNKSLTDFLNFYLLKSYTFFQDTGRGSTFINISQADLSDLKIPLPPLPIQRQIVAVLEQAEAVKRQRQEADALTGALLQSVFLEMFGDPAANHNKLYLKNFAECVDFQEGPGIMAEDFTESGIPLLRLTNIKESSVILDNCNFLSPEKVERKWKHFKIKDKDILISSSASTGIVSEVTKESEGAIPYTGIIRLRPKKPELERVYLKYFVGSPFFIHQIESFVTGSTIHHYAPTHLKRMQILVPPLAIQQQFARIVESVERIREQQVASGKEIEGLCEGLMARAFAGELPR